MDFDWMKIYLNGKKVFKKLRDTAQCRALLLTVRVWCVFSMHYNQCCKQYGILTNKLYKNERFNI